MTAATVAVSGEHQDLLTFLYSVPVGLVHASLDGGIELINSAAARWLMPLSPDGRLDNLFALLSVVSPDLRQSVLDHGAVAGVIVDNLRFEVRSGRRRAEPPVFVALTLSRLDDGRLIAVFNDATRQVRDERALADSEARLRGIFESATDAILMTDETQTILKVNPAGAWMFGCTEDEMTGMPLAQFMPERFRERHDQEVRAFGRSATSARHIGRTRDVTGLRRSGEEFPIDASISHLSLAGKTLFTAILRDVTERRKTEAALQSREATFAAALASMNDAVVIADAHGDLLEFNDAFATFHRCADKTECRHSLAEYEALFDIQPDDGAPPQPDRWPIPRALRGEVAGNVAYRLRRRDTGERWIGNFSFSPIRSPTGDVVGAVVTARDITAQRRIQAELRHSHANLRRLIAAQDRVQEEERKRIARELHDDLQQTLAAIRIDLSAIGDRLSVDAAQALQLVSRVDGLAREALEATRRILSDLRPQVIEDLGLVAALEEMSARFTERTGIGCHVDAPAEVGRELLQLPALASSLYRITQEALNNVAKHSRASRVEVGLCRTGEGLIQLRVSDNGVGIHSRDRRNPGSFGLLGVAERVHGLGGQWRIEGRTDQGTLIEVQVPTAPPPAVPLPGPDDFLGTADPEV